MIFARLKTSKVNGDLSLFLQALCIAIFLLVILSYLFFPQWETNDDLVMSMIAHGYGLAAQDTPNIFFSNIIWGYFIRLIPEINGVLGYSIATACVLVIVATTLQFGLRKLGLNGLTSLGLLVLIFLRPILFPQFTINSGLLMVVAIISIYLYCYKKKWYWLFVGSFFAYWSYLIRVHEAVLILLVALPLMPWKMLWTERAPKIALAILIPLVVISTVINNRAYQNDRWNAFMALNPIREKFTDWGVGEHLKKRPDLLKKYDYSENDIELITRWFFVDSTIANPLALKSMVGELNTLSSLHDSLSNAVKGLKTFLASPTLAPLVVAGIILAIAFPSRALGIAWCLSLVVAATIGFFGRPGIERIYIPLVSLLLISPFLIKQKKINYQKLGLHRFLLMVIFCAVVVNTYIVITENKSAAESSNNLSKELIGFPSSTVVAWGIAFPYELVYPVYRQTPLTKSFHFYGLNVFSLAPFSNSILGANKDGFKELFISGKGIPIIATEQNFLNLALYCSEHFHGKLQKIEIFRLGKNSIYQSRCAIDD
jgi:hypothetical protein